MILMRSYKQRKCERERERLVNCFVDWSVARVWSAGLMNLRRAEKEHKVQSRHSARERPAEILRLSLSLQQSILRVELSPHEFDYGFWRCRGRARMPGRDGWRGNKYCRSFNNSQWVSTAGHWCYSAHLLFPLRPLLDLPSTPASPSGIRKRTGPTSKRPQCDGSPGTFT